MGLAIVVYEKGQVIATEAGQVRVAVVQTSACQSCKARHGCGQALLSQVSDSASQEARNHFLIPYSGKVSEGDWVRLAIAEDRLALAAFWVYLWPLLIGFLALLIGVFLSLPEPAQLLMALSGGAVAWLVTRRQFRSVAQPWVPQVVEVQPAHEPFQ